MTDYNAPEPQSPTPVDAIAAALGGLGGGSKPQIAAEVSSGLAGLLANVLARRDEPEPLPEVEAPAPPPRLREASYEYLEPIDQPKPKPKFRSRQLTQEQLDIMLDALHRVEPRKGEEGLPHAVLLLKLTGADPRFEKVLLEATSQQLHEGMRQGDIVAMVGDLGLAIFVGGLFYPGDIEVLGSRIRRRTLERLTAVLDGVEFSIVMGGALGQPHEDYTDLLYRAVSTHDLSVAENRHDIVVDYGDNELARLL
jgi:hypothetical protein